MKESMPSRVQPDQAAQKPVSCVRDSLVCGCAAAGAALDMLDVLFITLFPPASLYWLFLSSVRKVSLYFYQTPMATGSLVIRQLPKRILIYHRIVTVPAPRRAAPSPAPVPRVRLTLDGR